MLKQRILTALVMAPVAIIGLFLLPPLPFRLFVGALITVSAWEWARLAGWEGIPRLVYAAVISLLLLASHLVPPVWVLGASLTWWAVAVLLVVRFPDLSDLWAARGTRIGIGLLVLIPGYVSLVTLSESADPRYLILLLLLLIWGADIGAYFVGRAFGRRKLAPRVSPGKSWAGFYGGLVTALLVAVAMAVWRGSPALVSPEGVKFLAACVLIAIVSVLGDLSVSMFKRHRGIKDSSNLLPGHGGFLDRLDSLLSAAPLFAAFTLAGIVM